jgi:hypothetical protein
MLLTITAAMHRIDDFLDVLDAGVIRPAQPDRVHLLVGDNFGNRAIRPGFADVEFAGHCGR